MRTPIALFIVALSAFGLVDTVGRAETENVPAETGTVIYFRADSEVHYGMAGFIRRVTAEAKAGQVRALVMGIDTFGGRVDAALEIVRMISSLQPIPTYALVEDQAWSAGALLALGCKAIYMRPGSTIGSAAPVSSPGVGPSEALGEKYVSALRAKFRAVAEQNGYPPNLAAAMVDKDIEVREVTLEGRKQYLTPDEIKLAQEQKQPITLGPVINPKDKLLNLTSQQALQVGLAAGEAASLDDLLKQAGLSSARVEEKQKNWAEVAAGFVTGSMLSGLLLMIGLFALYTEVSHPGFGWAGIIGITALGLLFWGKYITNLAEMTELLLFAAGVILLLLEIFVIPGFGLVGIAGIVLMAIGLYLAFVPFVLPRYPWDVSLFMKTILTMLVSVLASIAGFLVLLHYVPGIPGIRRLVLTNTQGTEAGFTVATPEMQAMVGWKGRAITDLHPVGKAQFDEKIIDVVAESGFIRKDAAVKIMEVQGNRILVRPC